MRVAVDFIQYESLTAPRLFSILVVLFLCNVLDALRFPAPVLNACVVPKTIHIQVTVGFHRRDIIISSHLSSPREFHTRFNQGGFSECPLFFQAQIPHTRTRLDGGNFLNLAAHVPLQCSQAWAGSRYTVAEPLSSPAGAG